MRRPGYRTVAVQRKGPRNKDGDTVYTTVGVYTRVSLQQTATQEATESGRAERIVGSFTLVFPQDADIKASDRLTVSPDQLVLSVDGRPHRPEYRSGRRTNLIVRAQEVTSA